MAGDIVGPNGSVLGIDPDPSMIAKASQRVLERGCSAWVRFQQADAGQFQAKQFFDAAVGRYVLGMLFC